VNVGRFIPNGMNYITMIVFFEEDVKRTEHESTMPPHEFTRRTAPRLLNYSHDHAPELISGANQKNIDPLDA
jgi:hypothetical protein